jgi:endonuclease YncB( thermonuclease family)
MRADNEKAPQKGAFFVWLLCVCSLFYQTAWADCAAGRVDDRATVDYVYDGDSFRLTDGRKIRIIGMDTPEMARDNKPAQAFAAQARQALIQLIGKTKRVNLVFDKESKDKYRRSLAHVYNESGRNVTEFMLGRGLAKLMIIPPNTKLAECYLAQEHKARKIKSGLWGSADYQEIPASSLGGKTQGYRVVSGKVVKISNNKNSIWLLLDHKLSVYIKKKDLDYFEGMPLQSLQGKTLIVRGRVFRSKTGLLMLARHSSAMELAP